MSSVLSLDVEVTAFFQMFEDVNSLAPSLRVISSDLFNSEEERLQKTHGYDQLGASGP